MKKIIFLMVIALVTAFVCGDAYAQPKAKKLKRIIVESPTTNLKLALYGLKDTLSFRAIGTANKNWDVNVRLLRKNAKEEDWFKDGDFDEICFKGRDAVYMWILRFYKNGDDIELLQYKLGAMNLEDKFIGKYK